MRYHACLTGGLACFGIGATSIFTGNPWLVVLFFPWLMVVGLFILALRKPGSSDFE